MLSQEKYHGYPSDDINNFKVQRRLTNSTLVGWKWFSSRGVRIAHDQNVVDAIIARTERVLENSARSKNYF